MKFLKFPLAVISFAFLSIFLLFTLADLHQPFRMINIFLHPHWTSPITVGAWIASGLMGVLTAMLYAIYIKKDEELYDKLFIAAFVLAIPTTLYTAWLMGGATARELWQMPTEAAQMILAATLAGSAAENAPRLPGPRCAHRLRPASGRKNAGRSDRHLWPQV